MMMMKFSKSCNATATNATWAFRSHYFASLHCNCNAIDTDENFEAVNTRRTIRDKFKSSASQSMAKLSSL